MKFELYSFKMNSEGKSEPVKKYNCICEEIEDGKTISGWCHKHKTQWL